MTPEKRDSPESPSENSAPKRQRTSEISDADKYELQTSEIPYSAQESRFPRTKHFQARSSLQRSIAVIASRDGFHSGNPDAMESFTAMVETCT